MKRNNTKYLFWSVLLSVALIGTVPAQDKTSEETIAVDTKLVLLRVAVSNKQGQNVPELKKQDFKIAEDGVEQAISFFSVEESPVSWGLVLDRSGSMMEMMSGVYNASLHVINEGTSKDEMLIVTFNEKPVITSPFTDDRHKLENSTLGLRAGGGTALYDAISFALDDMTQGKFRKKVLVVVTDGEDNASRITFAKLIERAEEEEAIIYTVGMLEPSSVMLLGSGFKSNQRLELEKLAEVTGGTAHFPTDVDGCRKVMKQIALEVSQQYSLGYYSGNEIYDGKWRNIRVKAGPGSKYVARTRSGYYARKRALKDSLPSTGSNQFSATGLARSTGNY